MGNSVNVGAVAQFVVQRLRELRLRQGLTAKELAQRAGIKSSSYACLEAGNYRLNIDNLFRVLLVLGVPISEVWPIDGARQVAEVTDEIVRAGIEQAKAILTRPPGIDDIIRAVCRVCDVDLLALQSAAKRPPLPEARTIAAILAHEQPHLKQARLAKALHKHPSSLTHMRKNAAEQAVRYPSLLERLAEARLLLNKPDGRMTRPGPA